MNDFKQLINAYNRFVPYKLIDLLGKGSIYDVKLGDQVEKIITILFSDIRDFTALSEALTPQENFNFINSYLSQIEPLITLNNGIVDKFIGDAIMAIFPISADDAFTCAVQILDQLKNYNEGRKRAGYSPIKIGIGLNTGIAMIGTVGGYNRMDGTVISDAVNLSSRIESLTKNYKVPFLISENTYHSINKSNRLYTRFIDRVLVKGKNRPHSIYEVFAVENEESKGKKLKNKEVFEEALANYHYKNIHVAQKQLQEYIKINPTDNPAGVYLQRCENYSRNGIHEGAYELTEKIYWDKSYLINHEVIDDQHRELVEASIRLIGMIRDKQDIEKIIEAMHGLEKKAKEHFHTEEKLMQEKSYPFLKQQKEMHNNFLSSFMWLKRLIEDGKLNHVYMMFRVQIFLIDWLVNHTKKEDKHFGKYLIMVEEM